MAVKRGLGKGLNKAGKGLDSLIAPKQGKASGTADKEEKKAATSVKKTETAAKAARGKKKEPAAAKTEINEEQIAVDLPAANKSETKEVVENVVTEKGTEKLESEAFEKEEASDSAKKAVSEAEKNQETFLKISDIEPNRNQPRKHFEEDALLELADSIRQHGVLSPILVQKSGDYYEIIAGERRWRAAKLAGLKEIPAIIRQYTQREVMEISLIENIQRENLNPIEEAQAYQRLLTEFELKQDELAERVSKSRTAVTNSMRLLKLDERVQKMVIDEMISSGHARALLAITDNDLQYTLALRVFDEKLSVRDIEKLVKQNNKERTSVRSNDIDQSLQLIYQDLEERMATVIGTKVSIHPKSSKKGKIEIAYHSNEELERLTELLLTSGNH